MNKESLLTLVKQTEKLIQNIYDGKFDQYLNGNQDVENFLIEYIEYLMLTIKDIINEGVK